MTTRLILPLELIAPLPRRDSPRLAYPWHDVATDWDMVTDAVCLLTWDGHQFGPYVGIDPGPPDFAAILDPCAEIGRTTLRALVKWAQGGSDVCEECGCRLRNVCEFHGEVDGAEWPGSFHRSIINRRLLDRFLRPIDSVFLRGSEVIVQSRGPTDPLLFIAEGWKLAVMPMNPENTEPDGAAFVFAGAPLTKGTKTWIQC